MTMKYSTKLSDAVHIMIFIHLNPNMDLSSQAIAKSLKSNPSFVRQILMKLRTAGLVQSVRGRPRPKLARDLGAISLLEIYRAVEGGKRLLHLDTHINPICNIGFNHPSRYPGRVRRLRPTAEGRQRTPVEESSHGRFRQRAGI